MNQATNFDWIRQMIPDLPFDKVEERMKNNSNSDQPNPISAEPTYFFAEL